MFAVQISRHSRPSSPVRYSSSRSLVRHLFVVSLIIRVTRQISDWTGAQIGNNDSETHFSPTFSRQLTLTSGSDDIKNVDLTKIHNLTGPVAVEGAEPGDCLVVDILDGNVQAFLCLLTVTD